MELTEIQLAELVLMNLEDVVSVNHPDAIHAFEVGKRIFDVSVNARRLDDFVALHKLRNRIDYRKALAGECPYPFERFWERPVYLIHDRNADNRKPKTG